MKKLNLILLAAFMLSVTSYAQLSSRENDNTSLKIGNRAQKGDMALTFGVPLSTGNEAELYDANMLNPGDFITVRYFTQNDIAIRGAVRFYKTSDKASGSDYEISPLDAETGTFAAKNSSSEYYLVPGIEKHFLNSNIFDVYMGADALIGFGKNLSLSEVENSTGAFMNYKSVQNSFNFGVEGVIGVNVFVAQLPISVGFEYGLGFLYAKEGKTKVTVEDDVNGEYEYYTYSGNMTIPGAQYKELKASTFGMNTNQNARILLNVYFGL